MRKFMGTLLGLSVALSAMACAAPSEEEPAPASDDALIGAPPLGPNPVGSRTRHAIVLAHGFDASPTNRWGFQGVAEALTADGHVVHVAAVPPYETPAVRAKALALHVDAAIAACKRVSGCDATKVNIIAHSMGGLDSRVLISKLNYGDRVASLTTISSPHRGTNVADVALGLVPGVADDAIDALAKCWSRSFTSEDLARSANLRGVLEALAESNAPSFNRDTPNDARVFYQSWAGVSSAAWLPNPKDLVACEGKFLSYRERRDGIHASLAPMAALTAHGSELRPNDGMATVESAKWGEFRGCIPADHLDEVGTGVPEGGHLWTGFDHKRFYRNVAFDLARRGF